MIVIVGQHFSRNIQLSLQRLPSQYIQIAGTYFAWRDQQLISRPVSQRIPRTIFVKYKLLSGVFTVHVRAMFWRPRRINYRS